MKTSSCAWHAYQTRIWAGLGLLFVLALAVFGKGFRFDGDCARATGAAEFAPGVHELADCLAAR